MHSALLAWQLITYYHIVHNPVTSREVATGNHPHFPLSPRLVVSPKKSGDMAPLKNNVHSTKKSNPRPMSDPPYGLIYCAECAQKWIHAHQENPTQSLRTTNRLNSNLQYQYLYHQLENCIHPNYFTPKNWHIRATKSAYIVNFSEMQADNKSCVIQNGTWFQFYLPSLG